ncbi:cellulose binding domain-containing protein [Glycomyces niveus]|uniref:Cellulose binding domain-containing protein n=1 Tax=Glycomyces niveus TaxID=2820287 RepID=A0ABS3U8G3_9ACTN|nr:cellulose binding domain-containing protein [Glycomyces sp. NEAU-S30]MBO3735050.1 cellulose binding domain-containing protein [Glycomyces sp. NEAU-S30]
MRPWMGRAVRRGRIHGRLLLALVAVAALASAAALWQFSALRDDHDPDLAQFDDDGESAAAAPTSAAEGPTGEAPTTPSPGVSASPSATASSSAPASEAATTAEAAVTGPQCTASLTLDNEWDDSVSVTVTIANTGADPVDGWEVVIGIKHLTVTSTWGLSHIEGERYGDILLNAALDQGESVDASFQADVQGNFEIPPTIPCTPV